MNSSWWQNNIVLKVNSQFTQCDSPHSHIRSRAQAIIEQEINLALHLQVGHILLDMPTGPRIDNFAALINRYMADPCLQHKFVVRLTIPNNEASAEKVYQQWLELK